MVNLYIESCISNSIHITIAQNNDCQYFNYAVPNNQMAEALPIALARALEGANTNLHSIHSIFTTHGPGSFSSLRAQLSFINLLTFCTAIKKYSIGTLDIIGFIGLQELNVDVVHGAIALSSDECYIQKVESDLSIYHEPEISSSYHELSNVYLIDSNSEYKISNYMMDYFRKINVNHLSKENLQPIYIKEPYVNRRQA